MSSSMFPKPPGVNPDLAEERTNLVFKQVNHIPIGYFLYNIEKQTAIKSCSNYKYWNTKSSSFYNYDQHF